MAYNEFAYFYDEFNGEADYDALYRYVKQQLDQHNVEDGVVVDLGCGTGDLTMMLAQAGYDMIGVDQSEEMLSVLEEKAVDLGLSGRVLLLQQNILNLDLFGTIRAAISTFDTYNHIGPLPQFEKAVAKAAFFMEKGGLFLFDLNTPYKHQQILGNNIFTIDAPDASCLWQNHYDEQAHRVDIHLQFTDKDLDETFEETFSEYTYPLELVQQVLERNGFCMESVCDGENFGPLTDSSQRYMIAAVKQYTQLEGDQVNE